MIRTSVSPACLHCSRYSSTTLGISLGAKAWRSMKSSTGRTTGSLKGDSLSVAEVSKCLFSPRLRIEKEGKKLSLPSLALDSSQLLVLSPSACRQSNAHPLCQERPGSQRDRLTSHSSVFPPP